MRRRPARPWRRSGGRPDSGLVGSGLDKWRAAAGRRGEISIRKTLMAAGILDDPDVRAWFSCRNPSDPSRNADIDVILLKGRTVWLLDAKRYAPRNENE